MANEKKELINDAKALMEDIFDNYDSYTDEEKQRIEDCMMQMSTLNLSLDKYDKSQKAKKSQRIWEKYKEGVNAFFGKK